MALVAESISKIVSIKIKPRQDSYTDQYSRIFMVKMCILTSLVTSVNYFKDTVTCIIANSNGMGGGFVGSACWIQGFYVFEELRTRLDESGYYGIPRNMDYDGLDSLGQLCSTENRALDAVPGCKAMKKLYFLQYQYMPFFMAALALVFYLPYMIFKATNVDLVSLQTSLKSPNINAEDIIKTYFNYRINNRNRMRVRTAANILVKVFYILANICTFVITDRILNGNFARFGLQWAQWTTLDNMVANDHDLRVRDRAKPADVLLPPMGFCEIHEASRDIRNTFINRHKFICEISPHVLYQYAFIVLWFVLVVGIIISIIGLLTVLFSLVFNNARLLGSSDPAKKVMQRLTFREVDYLEFIRRKNIPLYGDVIRKLAEERDGSSTPTKAPLL